MRKTRRKQVDAVLQDDAQHDTWDFLRPRYISTGFATLDAKLGRGGIPTKRITEISGNESVGKSLLLLRLIAQIQKQSNLPFLLIDTEFTFDPDWAKANGVDISKSKLIVVQSNIAETVFDDVLLPYLREGNICGAAVDSLGNIETITRATGKRYVVENGKEVKIDRPGLLAAIFGSYAKLLPEPINKHDIPLIFTNQIRDSISAYAAAFNTPGGRCYKHNRSLAMSLRKVEDIKLGDTVEGMKMHVKITKSKVSAIAEDIISVYFEDGEAKGRVFNAFDMAIERGIITKRAAWHYCQPLDLKWQGKEAVLNDLMENEDTLVAIEELVAGKNDGNADLPEEVVVDEEQQGSEEVAEV